MLLLKEKADKDLQQHNAEMKELIRIIDHDRKLREFMNTKGKERQEDPQLVAWRQRKGRIDLYTTMKRLCFPVIFVCSNNSNFGVSIILAHIVMYLHYHY